MCFFDEVVLFFAIYLTNELFSGAVTAEIVERL